MRVNFNRKFKGLRGEEIDTLISESISEALFSAGNNDGFRIENKDKFTAYKLCNKIMQAEKEIEITTEEATLIKNISLECFTAGAYGQIYELIENGK